MSRFVELHDDGPLRLKKDEMVAPIIAICRCGLSAKWPMCDGSHAKTKLETPDKLYAYTRDAAGALRAAEVERPFAADPRAGSGEPS